MPHVHRSIRLLELAISVYGLVAIIKTTRHTLPTSATTITKRDTRAHPYYFGCDHVVENDEFYIVDPEDCCVVAAPLAALPLTPVPLLPLGLYLPSLMETTGVSPISQ